MRYEPEQIGKIIREERKKRGWSQDQLGKKLHISGKQVSNYEKAHPLPSMEVLLKLAELFNCEYGYLLGEESYKEGSQLDTAICQSLGLSGKAIDRLRAATHAGLSCELEERQEAISRFFESPYLGEFLDCLVEAATISARLSAHADSDYQQLIDRYGDDLVDNALLLNMAGGAIPDRYEDNEELQEAKKAIDEIFEKNRSDDFSLKVARYELREAFEQIVRNLIYREYKAITQV